RHSQPAMQPSQSATPVLQPGWPGERRSAMAVDLDLIEQGIKPLPAAPAELAAMAELGPADYEIYSEMLSIICQEGKNIMTKMGISAMLHSGDSVAAIYTPQGDLVTAILGTYL